LRLPKRRRGFSGTGAGMAAAGIGTEVGAAVAPEVAPVARKSKKKQHYFSALMISLRSQ